MLDGISIVTETLADEFNQIKHSLWLICSVSLRIEEETAPNLMRIEIQDVSQQLGVLTRKCRHISEVSTSSKFLINLKHDSSA